MSTPEDRYYDRLNDLIAEDQERDFEEEKYNAELLKDETDDD
jgi:hypothetical protein